MNGRWWRRARSWALAAILATVALSIGHAGAASARGSGGHGEETFDGRYVLLHADPSVGPDIDVLRARHRTYELVLPSGSRPKPGAAVRVTGRLTGKTGQGGPVIAVSRVESPPPDVKRATPRLATSGDVRVLVVLAQWTGPDGVTPDSARQQILGDDAAWLHEASYGGVTLSGDVTGWLAIGTPAAACDYTDIDQRAEQAALVAGFDAARYDRVVIYFPHQNCGGTAGWGMIGGPVSWLNGYLDRRVSVHELGHTFGLNHAHLLRCVQGSVEVTLAASGCESVEYGDPFDAMGSSSYVGHFSAAQKDQLGWLGSGVGVANLASYPTVTLAPFERDRGTVAAKLPLPSGRTYYFEYRRPVGVDAGLPPGGLDGILVHLTDSRYGAGPELLDQRTNPASDAEDAALPLGTPWTMPEGWTITADPIGDGVHITATPPKPPANDAWAAAAALVGDTGTVDGTTSGATRETGEPAIAGNAGGASTWYRFQAPFNGILTLDTAGSGFDTLLGLYTGASVDALTLVAENDDGGVDPTSKVGPVALRKGATYTIAIDGYGGASGTTKLNWGFVAAPTLAVNDVSVKEGDKGTTTVAFTISRVGVLTTASSIDYRTVNGTATAANDYVVVPLKTLNFAAGEQTKTVAVKIKNDKKREKTENFFLILSGATGATILDPTGNATIIDND